MKIIDKRQKEPVRFDSLEVGEMCTTNSGLSWIKTHEYALPSDKGFNVISPDFNVVLWIKPETMVTPLNATLVIEND